MVEILDENALEQRVVKLKIIPVIIVLLLNIRIRENSNDSWMQALSSNITRIKVAKLHVIRWKDLFIKLQPWGFAFE